MTPELLARLLGMHAGTDANSLALVVEALTAPTPPQGEVGAAMCAAVVTGGVRFRLAGGVWSASDFATLSPWVQEALVDAGERFAAASAINAAKAARGPVGAAEVMVPIDGGAALRDAAAVEAMREARAAAAAALRVQP